MANDLEEAVAGSLLYKYQTEDKFREYKEELESELNEVKKRTKLSN